MFHDLGDLLGGRSAVPVEFRFNLKNMALLVLVVLTASTLFALTMKALK